MRRLIAVLALLLAACGEQAAVPSSPPPATEALAAQVQRGAYLALQGNCAGCHTAPGGAAYAGGRRLATPFGDVFAGNLTPHATGLGGWRAEDFWNALHHGRSRDGRRLLPAFPYPSYTQISRADADALFAYLQSLPAVAQANRPHALRFPYNTQAAIAVWQWLYFREGETPLPSASAELRRGAYLVQGLGHCAACHAPRNALGAAGSALRGGLMQAEGWWAPSLHPQQGQALPSTDELVALLRDGVNRHGSTAGPMARVVAGSLQHWREDDLRATAAYLLSLPPESPPAEDADPPSFEQRALGRRLYAKRCADCHGERGEGRPREGAAAGAPGAYPPLAGNATVLQPVVHNLVKLLQHGGFAPATAGNPRPYGMGPQQLSEAEMAAVLTHVRRSWGNAAAPVSALDVLQAR